MSTARVFKSGNSRAVRLPKEFQLEGAGVYVKKEGRGLLLTPIDDPWAALVGGLGKFSEDLPEERVQPPPELKETF
jgi:antitoxin VapB